MSIVTFWNDDREQTGKTLTAIAIATEMAIERNYKILLISTSFRDTTTRNCFWKNTKKSNLQFLGQGNSNIAVENGIAGLEKLVSSNKIQPSIITDYTKVVFKGRLEVLNGYNGIPGMPKEEAMRDYQRLAQCYPELIKLANQYYDMVLVDLDKDIDEQVRNEILEISNLNILVLSQRLQSLNLYKDEKQKDKKIRTPKNLAVIGKYIKETKYNKKNITRYLEERKEINIVPYNTLFFEAAEEADVTELFLKLRKIKDTTDDNYFFISEVLKTTNTILNRLQELQMKMR